MTPPVSAHARLEHTYAISSVQERYPKLPWQGVELSEDQRWPHKDRPARMAFAIVGGDCSLKEKIMFIAMENAIAPKHIHPGGEITTTLEGALIDVLESGQQVSHLAGMTPIVHGPGSVHEPRAEWWVGFCHQPLGSKPVS